MMVFVESALLCQHLFSCSSWQYRLCLSALLFAQRMRVHTNFNEEARNHFDLNSLFIMMFATNINFHFERDENKWTSFAFDRLKSVGCKSSFDSRMPLSASIDNSNQVKVCNALRLLCLMTKAFLADCKCLRPPTFHPHIIKT